MTLHQSRQGQTHFLFNDQIITDISPSLFHPPATNSENTLGRGTAYLLELGQNPVVLRFYRRGGLMRHLVKDSYLYGGLNQTRMWREMRILDWMHAQKLPAPEPVAACCHVIGGLLYRGALITRQISNAQTLAERLQQDPLTAALWQRIGHTIARFHTQGVYHADLNANNIMLNDIDQVFLIDFDKACRKTPAPGWQQSNLARLHRSLLKQQGLLSSFYFDHTNWQALLDGYGKV